VPFAFSVHLDLVRFLAALTVFLGHASGQRLTGGFLWQMQRFGPLAVVVFFVLSGWVISHVTAGRETDWHSYTVSRAARVYSVALPAVLFGTLLDAVGSHMRPDLYHIDWGYVAEDTGLRALLCLLFMDQLWLMHIVPGSNQPYWSLGFEVWYYAIFGLALFTPARWRPLAVVVALAVAGPRIVLLMAYWLLGVAAERACRGGLRWTPRAGLALALAALVAAVAVDVADTRLGPIVAPFLALIEEARFPYELTMAALFALHLMGMHAAAPLLERAARRVARPVRWFAGATFTLYLFHLPLAQFFSVVTPWPADHIGTRALVFGGTFLGCLAIAQVTERRKDIWRRWFAVLLAPLARGAANKSLAARG